MRTKIEIGHGVEGYGRNEAGLRGWGSNKH